jgi:hypothetical protein
VAIVDERQWAAFSHDDPLITFKLELLRRNRMAR